MHPRQSPQPPRRYAALGRTFCVLGSAIAVAALVACRDATSNSPPEEQAALGSANAPLVAIYYTDYSCSRCQDFAVHVLPEVERRLVATGRLQLVLREAPSDSVGVRAAIAARCAAEFGKHWAFHDALFAAGSSLRNETLLRVAALIGVPTDPFRRCLASPRYDRFSPSTGERAGGLPMLTIRRRIDKNELAVTVTTRSAAAIAAAARALLQQP